jgi:hypothetical protein
MPIDANVQTRANPQKWRGTRETAGALSRAASWHEGAAEQSMASRARAAARTVEIAELAGRQSYQTERDARTLWNERIRSILAGAKSGTQFMIDVPRLGSGPTRLDPIIERLGEMAPALLDPAGVMIDQARKPQTPTSRGALVSHPERQVRRQDQLATRVPHSSPQPDWINLATTLEGAGPLPPALFSPATVNALRNSRLRTQALLGEHPELLGRIAAALPKTWNQDAAAARSLEAAGWAASSGFQRNRSTPYRGSGEAEDQKSPDQTQNFALNRQIGPDSRSEPFFQGIIAQQDESNAWKAQLLSIAKDADMSESMSKAQPGADRTPARRDGLRAVARGLPGTKPAFGELPAELEDRHRLHRHEVMEQVRKSVRTETQRDVIDRMTATGTRMPQGPKVAFQRESIPVRERSSNLFEPTPGAASGTESRRIDTDRIARALEMFTQVLERFAAAGTVPGLLGGRSPTAPVPPALAAKPVPFASRTDGGRTLL